MTFDFILHSQVCVCAIFTFSKQFLWPGTEPLTYSKLYLVLTLHTWKGGGRCENIELKLQQQGQTSSKPCVCVCVFLSPCKCLYLQSISGDIHVSHHAGHLFPFKNFAWILHTDDERHTRSHYLTMKSQRLMSSTEECFTCVSVCLTPPGPEAPGLRCVFVCPWVAGCPLNPQRFITP